MESFRVARLKINRANKHIADIEELVSALQKTYTAEIDLHPKAGKPCIKHGFRGVEEFGDDMALMIGDALHNLRTSLDYAWIAALKIHLPSAVDEFSKFPVRPKRQDVEAALRGREIDALCPSLYKRVLSDIKPYGGGNDFILRLHNLDISDKHWELVPVIHYGSVRAIAFKNQDTGKIERGDTWGYTIPPPWFVPLPEGNWSVEDKGELSVTVCFGDVESLHGRKIIPELQSFSMLALNLVKLLEQV